MTPSKPKILVIRGGAIGDFILTLPAIAALRQQFSRAHLEVLGYPHIAQLAVAGALVDRVQPIEAGALAGFFARGGQLALHWTDYFSEFDLIISYLFDPDEIFRENVARCTPAQFIAGPHRPEETAGIHATQVFLKPLERLAIFDADTVPRLRMGSRSGHSQASAPEFTANLGTGGGPCLRMLAVHPGSGSESKNWPEPKWADLLRRLIDLTRLEFLLVGGEAEGGRLARLAEGLPAGRVSRAQSQPLEELARRLQACAGFIGHDSGISHLAAAMGLPCLVLWAETLEAVWRPAGERRVVILREPEGVSAILVERVVRELQVLLQSG